MVSASAWLTPLDSQRHCIDTGFAFGLNFRCIPAPKQTADIRIALFHRSVLSEIGSHVGGSMRLAALG
jgi:hypothetical protein